MSRNNNTTIEENEPQENKNQKNTKNKKNNVVLKFIIGGIIALCIIALILTLVFVLRKDDNKQEDPDDPSHPFPPEDFPTEVDKNDSIIIAHNTTTIYKLENEFTFNTKVHDLKRIKVHQKTYEDHIIDNNTTRLFYNRITLYDMYIISESDSNEDEKIFYDKMYTIAISIAGECFSRENENCEPKKLVDLTNSEKNEEENSEEIDDLKDIPLPLCLFNITNNDFVTSITCHKLIPEYKKRMIVLDVYFFRPPAIKRFNQENSNNTITYYNLDNNKKLIRETNGGICDIENAFSSFCTTDMNITIDSQLNLLEYEEVATMVVIKDENNAYEKNKFTKLIDETSQMSSFNPEEFEKSLNKLLPKLEPYFQTDILFTKEKYEEVYIASTKGVESLNLKLKRNLDEDSEIILKEKEIFNYSSEEGIGINMALMINPGLNTEYSEANYNMKIEDNKTNIETSKQSSLNFNKIINLLITLSEAGNHLATILLQNINNTIDNMTQELDKEISNLNSLVRYQDFSEIFDSTLSLESLNELPISIIQESINLNNRLSQLFTEIENGGMKKNLSTLHDDIYEFTRDSHNLLFELFNNLKKLSESLNSQKSKLTEIASYYLKNTTSSYIEIVKESDNILNNYYKIEYDLIKSQTDSLIKNFEDHLMESLQKENKIIENLYKNIENRKFTIQNSGDEEYKMILRNLYTIKNYKDDLKNKIKEKIRKEMDIKDSGYLISNYDISSNNYSFYDIREKLLNIANILDNDEYIDKVFDQIMINFRENATNILKNMDRQKEELFTLTDDVLSESLFTRGEQTNIQNTISNYTINIINTIRNENDDYLNETQEIINKLVNNKEDLFNLISNLTILFSENLEELANLYEKAFNSCLEKINNELHKNELLANEYFNNLNNIVNNKTKMSQLLKNYHIDSSHIPKRYYIFKWVFLKFEDTIGLESITQGYLTKYETYKTNFAKSQQYINNQLYKDLLSEYKKPITQIRELLQTFKNNKLSDKYLDLNELSFIDEHLRSIDDLFDRLNTKISDNIFNNKYVGKIIEYKSEREKNISKINQNIENQNIKIKRNNIANDHTNDFCVKFKRKISYGCVNGVVYAVLNKNDYYCFQSPYNSNYLKLIQHSINSDENLKKFLNTFNSFYSLISQKAKSYNEKIIEFKNSISLLEQKTINKKAVSNSLSQIRDEINSLLNMKYGEEIIKSSYNYYQNNTERIMGNLLNDISSKWNEAYDTLYEEVNNNLNNFKNSMNEFGIMSSIFNSFITQNITRIYYDSIENHQKNEMNYTIKYYYNVLLKLVQTNHQYIINKIPTNKIGFNTILEERKKEVNNYFTSLIQNIKKSENDSLSFDNQISALKVAKTNFFKINNILSDNIINTNASLTTRTGKILNLRNNKVNDEMSLTSRFYLENIISGKEIEELYEQITKKVFVYLNLEKFKDLLLENWIFDQDDFINKLNTTLYNSNLEISQEFSSLKKDFTNQLENQITRYFTKAIIEQRIADLYKSEVKELENSQVEGIKKYIVEILNKIKDHFKNEAIRLNSTSNSFSKDYTQIQNRLNEYKNEIFNKLKNTIFKIINDFHQNMMNKVYIDYVEKYLNEYIIESKKFTSGYEEEKLLNSSYNLREITDNIIENFVNDYKKIIQLKIDSKYDDYYQKIKDKVNLDNLQKLINNEISEGFNSILYPILKEIEKFNSDDAGYNQYDLNNDIQNDIQSTINSKISEIEKIMNTTKGNNYQVELNVLEWEILDFTKVYDDVLRTIQNSFDEFIMAVRANEENNINKFLQNIIKSNFNNFLNNIIPSFGNDFFTRIIKYNENFKIASLYNNLKYSLAETLTYYLFLYGSSSLTALTKDLKLKIYSLNNLDSIVENRNKQVLDLLETKVDEFIVDSKEFIIRRYKTMIETDASIESNFNELIIDKIKQNINLVQDEIEKDYTLLLNQYFKNQLIKSYTDVMNSKTNEMIRTIKNEREQLKINLDDLFTIQPDSVLEDINLKVNNTLDSIEKFNSHLNKVKISEQLINYLNSYGETKIRPIYESMIEFLNYETKDKIIANIEENSQNYIQNLNHSDFIPYSNYLYSLFETNYINPIKNNINTYGINDYPTNLENEINRINDRNRRRRARLLSEEEIEIARQEKIADKGIDDTFKNLLTSSNNTKSYINTFKKFQEFDELITNSINKVNLAYLSSQKRIIDNDYEEEVFNELNNKLENLKSISLDYYQQINQSYYRVKNYLIESINGIWTDLNKCANITYNTFTDKYNSISNEVESFDKEESEISQEKIQNTYVVGNQNQIISVNYTIINMTKKTKFKYDLLFEDAGIKKPFVKISINNENKPRKIYYELVKQLNGCGRHVESLEIEANDLNYTMNVDFNTQSTDINLTAINKFQAYHYFKEIYEIQEKSFHKCYVIQGVKTCHDNSYCDDNDKIIISSRQSKTVPENEGVENFVIKN